MNIIIGGNIAAKRKEKGWTQTELAAKIGVNQIQVSRWENGKHLPTVEQFIGIADALSCSLDELAGLARANSDNV